MYIKFLEMLNLRYWHLCMYICFELVLNDHLFFTSILFAYNIIVFRFYKDLSMITLGPQPHLYQSHHNSPFHRPQLYQSRHNSPFQFLIRGNNQHRIKWWVVVVGGG